MYDVKGKSIKQILSMDIDTFNNLTESEVRAVTRRLVSAANKRMRRIEKAGAWSPKYQEAVERGGFGVKGKTESQVRGEFRALKSFLKAESTTLKGARKFVKDVKGRLESKGFEDVETSDLPRLLSKIKFAKEDMTNIAEEVYKKFKELWMEYKGRKITYDTLEMLLDKFIEEKYIEAQQKFGVDNADVSDFFSKMRHL